MNEDVLINEQTAVDTNASNSDARSSSFVTFDCTEPHCVMQFRREDRLRAHLLIGSHKTVASSLRFLDKAAVLYKEAISADNVRQIPSLSAASSFDTTSSRVKHIPKEGWALFYPRPTVKFTPTQKSYLNEKYEEGEKSGAKWDPNRLAEASVVYR